MIENGQPEDLNAMEEAQGHHALADEFKRSQEDIAKTVGKSRSHVAGLMMRLDETAGGSAGLDHHMHTCQLAMPARISCA